MHQLDLEERWSVYQTLVFMAWGDDRLAAKEVSAARAVAEELDLAGNGRAGSALRGGPPLLGELALERLSRRAKYVAYGTAAWMAFADGHEHPAERAVLRMLRFRLDLEPRTAYLLEAAALLIFTQGEEATVRSQYRALLHAIHDVANAEDEGGGPFGGGGRGAPDSELGAEPA